MRLLPGVAGRFRRFKQRRRVARAHAELAGRAMQGRAWAARPHGLSRRLVVSLTSFPGRFDTLLPTLQSLLFQTMRPDAVQLWIAHEDVARLPDAVRQLEPLGLDVRACADMRSYKKIVPALAEEPESLIVTADDDIWYWPGWLEELVEAHRATGNTVVAHRAHRIVLRPDGHPDSYARWERPVRQSLAGPLIFPTGVHGVLYAPGALHPDVTRRDLFMSLAPSADDIWLYWMHRRCGSRPHVLALGHRILEWPGSQAVKLQSGNLAGGGNDLAVAAMISAFGFPGGD
jgi:hypothetical protein